MAVVMYTHSSIVESKLFRGSRGHGGIYSGAKGGEGDGKK